MRVPLVYLLVFFLILFDCKALGALCSMEWMFQSSGIVQEPQRHRLLTTKSNKQKVQKYIYIYIYFATEEMLAQIHKLENVYSNIFLVSADWTAERLKLLLILFGCYCCCCCCYMHACYRIGRWCADISIRTVPFKCF